VALAGVAKYPARVKCALLGWMAFTDALNRTGIDTSDLTTTDLTHTDLTSADLSPETRGETP
jgi:nitrogen fixation NifU-like protein